MKELGRMLGEMEYDGLISGLNPPVLVGGGVLSAAAGGAGTEYKRGTVLAKSASSGQLSILGAAAGDDDTLTADCILCDDVTVDAAGAVPVAVYLAGCFNSAKLTVAEGYAMTEADKDALRMRGIFLKAAAE